MVDDILISLNMVIKQVILILEPNRSTFTVNKLANVVRRYTKVIA